MARITSTLTTENNNVDLLKAVLAISRQDGIIAIAHEACKQVVEMLGVFTVSFAVVNMEEKTGHLITEYISEPRDTDPKWFQPLYYPDLPIFAHVIENRKTFHFHKDDPEIADAPEMTIFKDFIAKQIVLVPVMARNDVFGLLLLWDRSQTRVFDENDIAFLELLANNIGIIAEREHLLTESEQHTRELEILHDLSQALSVSPNLKDVVRLVVEGINKIDKKVLCARVILGSLETTTLRYAHCFETNRDVDCLEDSVLTQEVLKTGKRLIIENTQLSRDKEFCLIKVKPRALVGFPLRAAGNLLGALQIAYQDPKEFSPRSINSLEMLADRAAVSIRNQQLLDAITNQAMTDVLTGLANRRAFEQALKKEIARTKRNSSEFCLLFIDLDEFKQVNDLFGHPVGDMTLQGVARCFEASTRGSDVVTRLGGDEFVILLPDTGTIGGEKVSRTIQESLRKYPFNWKSQTEGFGFGASIGVVQYPNQADSIEALYQLGDELLYRDKDREK